jgi:rhombotail lipoprotein
LSISYGTVVGIYVVPGEKNDTKTMIDAAVYDIASRKLLFRAPGIGDVKAAATPINWSEELREDSKKGFEEASTDLTANLKIQLAEFKEKVTNSPAEYKIEYKPGYKSGAFGGLEIMVVGALGTCFYGHVEIPKSRQTPAGRYVAYGWRWTVGRPASGWGFLAGL